MDIVVEMLIQLDSGEPHSYYADGHHDPADFIRALEIQQDVSTTPDCVRHVHYTFVPADDEYRDFGDELMFLECSSEEGAPATVVHADDCMDVP